MRQKEINDVSRGACDGVAPDGQSLSFRSALGRARKQAELDAFDRSIRGQVDELCKIVALAYVSQPDNRVYIDGEAYSARVVAEVFAELTAEHFERVALAFAALQVPVTNKRAYLTTALFNSVFELESDAVNRAGCL